MRQDEICNDILALCMKGLIYHSFLCVIYNIASEKTLQMNLRLLLIYVPIMLFAVIRRKCDNFFVFMLFHVLISGFLALIFPGLEERVVIGGSSVLLAFISIHIRLKGEQMEEECPAIASLLLFLVCYAAASQMKRPQVMQICHYEVYLFLILFVSYKSLSATAMFLKENEKIDNLPARQIKGSYQSLLGIFIIFLAAGMFLMPYLPVSKLFEGAADLIKMVIRKILLLLMWIFTRDVSEMDFWEESASGEIGAIEAGKPSLLAQFLEWFLVLAAGIVLAGGAIYLLIRFFCELYRRFYEKNQETADESEFIWENPVKIHMIRNRQKKIMISDKGINDKIRHLYKKSIRKKFGTKTAIPAFMTPTELEQLSEEKNMDATARKEIDAWEEKRKQRIQLYQKARYSQYECDKQELEAMKKNL